MMNNGDCQQEGKSSSSCKDPEGATESQPQQKPPQIHKGPRTLKTRKLWKDFMPKVISLGPYHRNKKALIPMEEEKKKAAELFTSNKTEEYREKVRKVVQKARECYQLENDIISDKDFEDMMFFDGCFILYIINCLVNGDKLKLKLRPHLLPWVIEDMFLVENQLPFLVLKALMTDDKKLPRQDSTTDDEDDKNLTKMIDKFLLNVTESEVNVPAVFFHLLFNPIKFVIMFIFLPWIVLRELKLMSKMSQQRCDRKNSFTNICKKGEQGHLLQLLRLELLNYSHDESCDKLPEYWIPPRSATELRAAGIVFKKSWSKSVKDVHFEPGIVFGYLYLPSMSHLTKRRLLNLIAYELGDGEQCSYGITSYICFLDGLIDRQEDVKELRSMNLLPKGLGTDEEAAQFFNTVGQDLHPDPYAYIGELEKIKAHCNTKWRTDLACLYYDYLSSPWSIISVFAAALVIFLTAVQTYFAVFST